MPSLLILQSAGLDAQPLLNVLRQHVAGELAVATSIEDALSTIDERVPDVILLPALMQPADEDHLMAYLGTIPGAAHVQAIKIPLADFRPPALTAHSLFSARRRADTSGTPGDTLAGFAREVAAYLACASARKEEIRQPRTDGLTIRGFERRDSPRWSPDEVPWVSLIRFADGHDASLINLSLGGALLHTHARPDRRSFRRADPEALERPLLTLRLDSGDEVRTTGRIVRCCTIAGPTRVEYEVALRFDESLASMMVPGGQALIRLTDINHTDRTASVGVSRWDPLRPGLPSVSPD